MVIRGGLGFWECGIVAVAAAAVSAFVELCTKDGYDTFTCPAAAMVMILPLIHLMGG
jgi:hypothetical protein